MKKITEHQQQHRTGFNRYVGTFCLILVFLFATTIVNAAVREYELEVDFSFDIDGVPDKVVTGYQLYRDGVPARSLCTIISTEPQCVSCSVIDGGGNYPFTLTALYDDGTESPHSAPFSFVIAPHGDINGDGTVGLNDAIIGLQVLMNVTPDELTTVADVNGDGRIGLDEVLYAMNNL